MTWDRRASTCKVSSMGCTLLASPCTCREQQVFHGEDWWAEAPCEHAFGMVVILRSWFGVSCNLSVFSCSSLVFDCLTICNIFILSKMKGTAIYSLKGEKQGTEKLSASNNIVKTQKWSTRINLFSSSTCPACRSTSVHLQERQELSAPSCRTWANHSFQSWHLLPLLAHLKDALSTHTLEKPFMCTIIGKKAEISEKKRCAKKWIMILCSFDLLTSGSYVCMVI